MSRALAEPLFAQFPEWLALAVADGEGAFDLRIPQPGTDRALSIRTESGEVDVAFDAWRVRISTVADALEIILGWIAEERVITVVLRNGRFDSARLERVGRRLEPERNTTTRTYSWLRTYDRVVESV